MGLQATHTHTLTNIWNNDQLSTIFVHEKTYTHKNINKVKCLGKNKINFLYFTPKTIIKNCKILNFHLLHLFLSRFVSAYYSRFSLM
jgi:hypothetical protein